MVGGTVCQKSIAETFEKDPALSAKFDRLAYPARDTPLRVRLNLFEYVFKKKSRLRNTKRRHSLSRIRVLVFVSFGVHARCQRAIRPHALESPSTRAAVPRRQHDTLRTRFAPVGRSGVLAPFRNPFGRPKHPCVCVCVAHIISHADSPETR